MTEKTGARAGEVCADCPSPEQLGRMALFGVCPGPEEVGFTITHSYIGDPENASHGSDSIKICPRVQRLRPRGRKLS